MDMAKRSAEDELEEFLKEIMAKANKELKRRIEDPQSHAWKEALKRLWHPAIGHFKYLHPEYEVTDFLDGKRYIDLAYIRPPYRIAFEIDGRSPHLKDASQRDFCNERLRAFHLVMDGWIVIRIGYVDLKERPRMWQQNLQQLIGKLYGHEEQAEKHQLNSREEEILRLCQRLERPVRLAEVEKFLKCGHRKARRLLDGLTERNLMERVGGGPSRAHAWRYIGRI